MRRLLELTLLGIGCCALQPVVAWEGGQAESRIRVVPAENIKIDYAQVLRVEPVYQTLRASRTEQRCEPLPPVTQKQAEKKPEPGALSRMWDSIRGAFTSEAAAEPAPAPSVATPPRRENCHLVCRSTASSSVRSPTTWTTSTRARSTARGWQRTRATACVSACRSRRGKPKRRPCRPPERAPPAPARRCLRLRPPACDHACPMNTDLQPHAASAARMASGMTSRARRPESHISAG